MKGKRYSTEQKIRILRAADAGRTIVDVCREAGISEQTFHRWKRELGMLEVDQAKQLKELQKESARLKRMLADEILGKELLKEALEKNGKPCTQARTGANSGVAGKLISAYGSPEHIRSDNGSEFIEKSLCSWYADEGIKTLTIEPGSPWQNGYIESFNGRLRDECLNREWFYTLTEARVVIEDWRWYRGA